MDTHLLGAAMNSATISRSAEWYRDELVKWGMNFHWHAWEPVAARYDPDVFAEQFRGGGVPTVSLEAKCALGWSYYPSSFGVVHPKLRREDGSVFDYFGSRVRVVKEHGGRVIAYYCLGMEGPLFHEHPDWRWYTSASWDPERGEHWLAPHKENTWELTSLFSPYVDQVLLPQLAELVARYPIDVLWLDIFWIDHGHPDYNPYARGRFRADMGRDLLPMAEDPDFRATVAYFRSEGRRIRERICDHVRAAARQAGHATHIAVNWAHTPLAPTPRPVGAPPTDVDILSCDVVQGVCGNVHELGLHARSFASLGLPSDVISTNFRWWGEWDMKPLEALFREAAITIANGSTYYIYEYAYPDGRFEPGRVAHVRAVADWVAARQEVFRRTARAQRSRPQAEITVLLSTQTNEEATSEHWVRECFESLEGASRLLQTTARAFQICDEARLATHLANCHLLVLPHVATLSDATAQQIGEWVEAGGTVLVVGPVPPALGDRWGIHTEERARSVIFAGRAVDPMAELLDAKNLERTPYGYLEPASPAIEEIEPVPLVLWGRFYPFEPGDADVLMTYRYPGAKPVLEAGASYGAIMGYSAPGEETIAGAALRSVGQGRILVCGADVFRAYWAQPNYRFHQLFESWLRVLDYQPEVEVTEGGKPAYGIELITALESSGEGALLVHLINLREAHTSGVVAEWLPPAYGLRLRVRGMAGTTATRLPEGTPLAVGDEGGDAIVDLPPIAVHACIEIREDLS